MNYRIKKIIISLKIQFRNINNNYVYLYILLIGNINKISCAYINIISHLFLILNNDRYNFSTYIGFINYEMLIVYLHDIEKRVAYNNIITRPLQISAIFLFAVSLLLQNINLSRSHLTSKKISILYRCVSGRLPGVWLSLAQTAVTTNLKKKNKKKRSLYRTFSPYN